MKTNTQILDKKWCCNRTFNIEGIGNVTFPPGVFTVNIEKDTEIKLYDEIPDNDELTSTIESIKYALEAVNELYDEKLSSQIQNAFSSIFNYKGQSKIKLKLPFKIILSEDFYGIKFSVLLDLSKFKFSYNIEQFIEDKLKAIDFLQNDPILNPKAFPITRSIDSTTTQKSVEEILTALAGKLSTNDMLEYEKLDNVQDLLRRAKRDGIDIRETFNIGEELLNMSGEFTPTEVDNISVTEVIDEPCVDCPDRETNLTHFKPEEVNIISTQCCEPVEESLNESVDIPESTKEDLPNTPLTDTDISKMVDTVRKISDDLKKCSDEKAFADAYREKLYKIREDLYPLYLYVTKRNEYFESYEQIISYQNTIAKQYANIIKDLSNIVSIGTKAIKTFTKDTGISTSDIDTLKLDPSLKNINTVLTKITDSSLKTKWGSAFSTYNTSITTYINDINTSNTSITDYLAIIDKLEHENSYTPILTGTSLNLLRTSNSVDIVNLSEIFSPTEDTNNTNYTNQSGINLKNKGNFYLLIDTEKTIYDEIKTIFDMIDEIGNFEVLYKPSSKLSKTGTSTGIVYKNVWDKYDSISRIDFLFTSAEQGYISAKPTTDQVINNDVENVEVDEKVMTKFLSTFDAEQEIRLLTKIVEARKIDTEYFSKIETFAKTEAAKTYQYETFALLFGLDNITKKFKDQKAKYKAEYDTISKFNAALGDKIDSLISFSNQKKKCFEQQEQNLKDLYDTNEEDTSLASPCSDPKGIGQMNPLNPSYIKNCYWKEYTKNLQTVSFMPIPDIKNFNKRLFRYYPVGLQIPVPAIPGVLPTLPLGIPDIRISIPLPILWKHLFTLTTPAGQFVLWITYCPPFTVFPYLMFIDEVQNTTFILTPKGPTPVPIKSLGWKDHFEKSIIEKIPGLKIPMPSLPPVDSNVNNNLPDTVKSWLEELKGGVKKTIDQINTPKDTVTASDLEKNKRLLSFKKTMKTIIDKLDKGIISDDFIEVIKQYVSFIENEVALRATKMIDFEPFYVPNSVSKALQLDAITEANSLKQRVLKLQKSGINLNINTLDFTVIVKEKILNILETKSGKKIISNFDREIQELENEIKNKTYGVYSAEEQHRKRIILIQKYFSEIIKKITSKIVLRDFGITEEMTSLIPIFLPFPCKSNISISPIPSWLILIIAAIKKLDSIVTSDDMTIKIDKAVSSQYNFALRLPSARDLISDITQDVLIQVMNSVSVPVPGWPSAVPFIEKPSIVKQLIQNSLTDIFKTKLRMPAIGGITPMKIEPDSVKKLASPVIDIAVETVFSILIEIIIKQIASANEQNNIQTIKNILQITKSVLGTNIEDLTSEDLNEIATAFTKNAILEVESSLNDTLHLLDVPSKQLVSFMALFSPIQGIKSSILLNNQKGPYIEIGTDIIRALMSKNKITPNFLTTLLLCTTGIPGWTISSLFNPSRSIEKLPPWERLCLKNAPYVVFLDQIAATAQRIGGLGNSYLAPYYTPE